MLTEQEKNYVNAAVQGAFILTYVDTCELEVVPVTSIILTQRLETHLWKLAYWEKYPR